MGTPALEDEFRRRGFALTRDRPDIVLGRTAGIPTILVLSGETQVEDLLGSPHHPSYNFQDLGAVADAVVDSRMKR